MSQFISHGFKALPMHSNVNYLSQVHARLGHFFTKQVVSKFFPKSEIKRISQSVSSYDSLKKRVNVANAKIDIGKKYWICMNAIVTLCLVYYFKNPPSTRQIIDLNDKTDRIALMYSCPLQ